MPDVREVYEMVTKQKPPQPGALERQQKRQVRAARNKRIGAYVVAAAIVLAAAVPILVTSSGEDVTTPAGAPAVNTAAEEVATGFVEAFGAFDADRAIAYLADDADLSGLDQGGTRNLRLLLSLLEAQGYKQMLTSCEESGSTASGTDVGCTFDFHAIRSDEIGRGPYSGSYFDLTVRDREIVRASLYWEIGQFSPQMWEPFAKWVSSTHPKDFAVMYMDTGSNWRLTEESIRLWEQRTREYVETVLADPVAIAERFMEARNAYDAETAMSLLADNGATVLMMHNNAMWPDMPTVRLDRDELALALEAERIYGVRYGSFECRPDPVGWAETQITCSYLMDNRLRQIQGFPPKASSFGIGIRNNRITNLSFPWLNVGFPGEVPAEGARFVQWLESEHPEAGGRFDRGELFRIAGQEVTLILTPESLDLLAGYLEEYERSVSG